MCTSLEDFFFFLVVLSGIRQRWPRKLLNLGEINKCTCDIHECVPCSLHYLMKWHMNACACIRDQRYNHVFSAVIHKETKHCYTDLVWSKFSSFLRSSGFINNAHFAPSRSVGLPRTASRLFSTVQDPDLIIPSLYVDGLFFFGHVWKLPLHFLNALADTGVSGMTRTTR